jgi:hypothetical protein
VLYTSLGILLQPQWAALLMSASTMIVTFNAAPAAPAHPSRVAARPYARHDGGCRQKRVRDLLEADVGQTESSPPACLASNHDVFSATSLADHLGLDDAV